MKDTSIKQYHDGEIIVRQGDTAKNLYKILSGNVTLYIDYDTPEEYLVGIRSFPHCFGEMTILADQPSYYTVVSLGDTTILRVPENNFESFIQNNYQNAILIMKTIAKNLTLLDLNLNMLLDEIRTVSKSDKTDTKSLQLLAERYTAPERSLAAAAGTLPEGHGPQAEGLFLPGHKHYPNITHPEYETHLLEKRFTCPHCEQQFYAKEIPYHRLRPLRKPQGGRAYDVHILYEGFEPEWYDIVTCPHCHFSMFSEIFSEGRIKDKNAYEKQLHAAAEALHSHLCGEQRDLYFVFAQHYIALLCAFAYGEEEEKILRARIWLDLCRLYKSVSDEVAAMQAEDKILELCRQVGASYSFTSEEEQQLCMAAAGILFYRGKYREARSWANKVYLNNLSSEFYSKLAHRMIKDINGQVGG